jgi:hypothetical protein
VRSLSEVSDQCVRIVSKETTMLKCQVLGGQGKEIQGVLDKWVQEHQGIRLLDVNTVVQADWFNVILFYEE